MSFPSQQEAETRLCDPAPLTEKEIRDLMVWMGSLSTGAIRRLDAESALQSLTAIRKFDVSSGKIGIWGLALNVGLFVLTIVATVIAIASYRDANETSKRQEKVLTEQKAALDASRSALEGVVKVVERQTNLLEKSLNTSESQLSIIKEQNQRELEKPDVEAFFLYPQKPSILIHNKSKTKVAHGVLYEARFWNLSKPVGSSYEFTGSKVGSFDAVRPEGTFGPNPFELFTGTSPSIPAEGEQLFGYVMVQCPDCQSPHFYWMYVVVGKTGLYREGKLTEFDWYHLTSNDYDKALGFIRSSKKLISMPSTYP